MFANASSNIKIQDIITTTISNTGNKANGIKMYF